MRKTRKVRLRKIQSKPIKIDAIAILAISEINNNNHGESIESDHHTHNHTHSHSNLHLGNGRSSKAVSYQDIHSAYTKKTYKHVTSKVRKYIADMQRQEEQQRNRAGTFQRHRSMPECLTPRGNAEDQQKLDESLSLDESYERLLKEKQSYIDYLQEALSKQTEANFQLKKNFEVIRDDLTECKDQMKRQAALIKETELRNAIHSYAYGLPLRNHSTGSVARATQTDVTLATNHVWNISDLSDIPGHTPLNLNSSSDEGISTATTNNQSYSQTEFKGPPNNGRQKQRLASRMLRLFGPCARCDDPNQTIEDSKATYTVELPLLGDECTRQRDRR